MKLSIITVVYNNKIGLENTIQSIIAQNNKDYEYIVIDGKSTDGTLDIITKYEDHITTWISEKDAGIYDAMNKGIKLAQGEYIYFLNSGDILYDDKVLDNVINYILTFKADIYCGNIDKIYDNFSIIHTAKDYDLKKGMMPPHQGTFVSRDYIQTNLFNTKYKSSGDFEFFCKAQKFKQIISCFDLLVAKMPSGGMSSNKKLSYTESAKVIDKYFGFYIASLYFFNKIILEQGLKKILITLRLKSVYQYLLRVKS